MSNPPEGRAENPNGTLGYRRYEPTHISHENNRPMILPSQDSRRLLWTLDEPTLGSAIWVTNISNSPDSQQPYYDSATGTWHEISQFSMFEPKCSSITVRVDDLERWEDNWLEYHEHSDSPEWCVPSARWGTNPDLIHVEDWGEGTHLLECCGTQRPLGKAVRSASFVYTLGRREVLTSHQRTGRGII